MIDHTEMMTLARTYGGMSVVARNGVKMMGTPFAVCDLLQDRVVICAAYFAAFPSYEDAALTRYLGALTVGIGAGAANDEDAAEVLEMLDHCGVEVIVGFDTTAKTQGQMLHDFSEAVRAKQDETV